MIEFIKQTFVAFVRELGYSVSDTWTTNQSLPRINARINGAYTNNTRDVNQLSLTITLDIFSDYKGEKEILTIVEAINNHLHELRDAHAEIINVDMTSLHILDDNSAGVLRKHGVASYTFTLAKGDE